MCCCWLVCFAPSVAFAGHGAAPSAAVARRCSFSDWPAGGPSPVFEAAFGDLALAWPLVFVLVADISDRPSHFPCSEVCRRAAALHWRVCSCSGVAHCYSPDDSPRSGGLDFRGAVCCRAWRWAEALCIRRPLVETRPLHF